MIYTVEMPTFTVVFLDDGTSYRVLGKECRYRGEPAGQPMPVDCKTCKGVVRKTYQPYVCSLHKRCIPDLVISPENLGEWKERKPESDIYTLCQGCTDKTCLSPVLD